MSSNIAEAFGRRRGPDRDRVLVIARAETEETMQHLKTNYRDGRIPVREYWPVHNILNVIVKMLDSMLARGSA